MKSPGRLRTGTFSFLRRRVVRAGFWTIVGHSCQLAVRLGSNIVLARLLFPEAFGLMALVAVLQQGISMFSDIGITQAVIQKKRGDDPAFLATAWILQVCRGFFIWLTVCMLAQPFASYFEQPILATVVPVAGISAIIIGLQSIAMSTATRKLVLHRVVVVELTAQVVGAFVMIGWALQSPTIWALVAGGIVTSALTTILSHMILPARQLRLRIERQSIYELFTFGRWITLSSALNFISDKGERLIFGKLFPLGFLGVYAIASNLERAPRLLLTRLGTRVVFPKLSQSAREQRRKLIAQLRTARLTIGLAGTSIAAILGAQGDAIIGFLYDERYHQAGWVLELLSIRVALGALSVPAGQYLLSQGNSQSQFILSAYRATWVIAVVAPAAYFFDVFEAILAFALIGIGNVIIVNYLLYDVRLVMPIINALLISWFSILFLTLQAL